MYLVRTPALVDALARGLLWRVRTDRREVYLTFDDGPEPTVTPWVLDRLAEYGAKATFFCIGRNAVDHPGALDRIRAEGHGVGNHTWDHANGWRTKDLRYYRSILRADTVLGSPLFRPPYGRITPAQASAIGRRFVPVMWDVLSGDFDTGLEGGHCSANVLNNVRPGSIVVFHDSLKAWDRLRTALPAVLSGLSEAGYSFAALDAGATSRPADRQAPMPPPRS